MNPVSSAGPGGGSGGAARLSTWQEWVSGYEGDIIRLHLDRYFFREILAMLRTNPAIREPWHIGRWLVRIYIQAVSVGVRRQTDGRQDVLNLRRLMQDVQRNPEALSRDAWLATWGEIGPRERELANEDFDAFSAGGDHVDPEMVRADIAALGEAVEQARVFVNNQVAHLNSERALGRVEFESLSLDELDAALDQIGRLHEKYYLLVCGRSLANCTPTPQYNWRAAFTVPWLADEVRTVDRVEVAPVRVAGPECAQSGHSSSEGAADTPHA